MNHVLRSLSIAFLSINVCTPTFAMGNEKSIILLENSAVSVASAEFGNANINVESKVGSNALLDAAKAGHNEVIRELLDAGVEIQGEWGKNALRCVLFNAAAKGHDGAISKLLDLGADIHEQGAAGRTALHLASLGEKSSTVSLLICCGAKVNVHDSDSGDTPLLLAAWRRHHEVLRVLIAAGADVKASRKDGNTALHFVAGVEDLALLIGAGADISAKNKIGRTVLHEVSARGHVGAVKVLIAAGAAPSVSDTRYGDTPLHLAAWQGHEEVVKLLIEAGADVEAKRSDGYTALHFASGRGHIKVLEVLAAAGANLNAKAIYNEKKLQYDHTPLSVAAVHGHIGAAKMLIAAGANLHLKSESGATLLHNASVPENHETVNELMKLFLSAALDVNARDLNARSTALHSAALRGHVDAVKQLLAAGAYVKAVSSTKMTALHFIAHGCHNNSDDIGAMKIYPESECKTCCDVVKVLIDAGVPPDAKNEKGLTALELAVRQGHDAVVRQLQASAIVAESELAVREADARARGRIEAIKVAALEEKRSEEFRVKVKDILKENQKYWHSSFSDLMISTRSNKSHAKRAEKRLCIISQELFSRLNSLEENQVSLFIDFFERSQALTDVRDVKKILIELCRKKELALVSRSSVKDILAKDQKEWIISLTKLIKADLDTNESNSARKKLEIVAEELFPRLDELKDETRIRGFIFFFKPEQQMEATGMVKVVFSILTGHEKPKPEASIDLASSFSKRRATVAEHHSDSEDDEAGPTDWDDFKPVAPCGSDSMSLVNSSSLDSLSESSQSSKTSAIKNPPPVPVRAETPLLPPALPPRGVSLTNIRAKARALFSNVSNKNKTADQK